MSTFIPAIPLLTADESTTKLAKTVVETSPGVFALNTVGGGGGSEVTLVRYNKIIDIELSKFVKTELYGGGYRYYVSNYPKDYNMWIVKPTDDLPLYKVHIEDYYSPINQYTGLVYLKNNDTIVYIGGSNDVIIPFNYIPIGLPE